MTEEDMSQNDDIFFCIIDFQLRQGLGQFLINQCNIPNQIASDGVFRIFWATQLNDFGQVVQHNPCKKEAFIELRIDVANRIR